MIKPIKSCSRESSTPLKEMTMKVKKHPENIKLTTKDKQSIAR
jgi:hypothetical protein